MKTVLLHSSVRSGHLFSISVWTLKGTVSQGFLICFLVLKTKSVLFQ
jgi:hypothetical protein